MCRWRERYRMLVASEEVGDDVVTTFRHPSPKIHSATRAPTLQPVLWEPGPPLAIIERGRASDGKGALLAAFACSLASP